MRKISLVTSLPALAMLVLLAGCGADDSAKEAKLDSQMPPDKLYNTGMDNVAQGEYTKASKKFDTIEQNYPYSPWATDAELMHGYADYMRDDYTDAISSLDRFIQLHPAHRHIAYAYYLRALCYYEQIADIQRDQKTTQQAMAALQEVVNRFPDTAYGHDAKLKIDLCRDHLAGKEMEVGRWYEKQHLYTAAINRFQRVVDDFQTTNHVAEALSRLTEIYLKLGLTSEAKRTASVLGYNYPGSPWYSDSYRQLVDEGVKPTQTTQAPKTALPAQAAQVPQDNGGWFSWLPDWPF